MCLVVNVGTEHQTLLVRQKTLLVRDLGLDVLNGVVGLDLNSDGLAVRVEDLHTTSQTEHQMQSGLLLEVVLGSLSGRSCKSQSNYAGQENLLGVVVGKGMAEDERGHSQPKICGCCSRQGSSNCLPPRGEFNEFQVNSIAIALRFRFDVLDFRFDFRSDFQYRMIVFRFVWL